MRLGRLYVAAWAGLLATVVVGETAAYATGLIVALPAPILLLLGTLVAVGFVYRRRDARVACVTAILLWSLLGTLAHIVLEYASLRLDRPLVSSTLLAFDRTLGFDWRWYVETVSGSAARDILVFLYGATGSLTLLALMVASWRGARIRVTRYMAASTVALSLSDLIFALFPANDPATLLGIPYGPSEGWASVISTLRAGTPLTLAANHLDGIVSFPSVHTAGILLLAWFVWPVRAMRPATAALTVATLAAIPMAGAHYLTDMLAGAVLVAIALLPFAKLPVRTTREAAPAG